MMIFFQKNIITSFYINKINNIQYYLVYKYNNKMKQITILINQIIISTIWYINIIK